MRQPSPVAILALVALFLSGERHRLRISRCLRSAFGAAVGAWRQTMEHKVEMKRPAVPGRHVTDERECNRREDVFGHSRW